MEVNKLIYRIDIQHFITHAIDHFTSDELIACKYVLFSAKITNQGTRLNVTKITDLYPTPSIVTNYAEYQDDKLMEEMYMDFLNPKKRKKGDEWIENKIYDTFIKPLMNHETTVIVCDKNENIYVDVFCKYLKDRFSIEVIDLNELFIKGHTGPIYLDRTEVHNKSVEVARDVVRKKAAALESTADGREKLFNAMNKKEKIRKLKELGIEINGADKDHIDEILREAWINQDETNDYVEWKQ